MINFLILKWEKLIVIFFQKLNPEISSFIARFLLKIKLYKFPKNYHSHRLHCSINNIQLENPIGLAAGFDKNGYLIKPLTKSNFSFIEIGTTTLNKQKGNPSPRLFRLPKDQALINSFGFNNIGIDKVLTRFKKNNLNNIIGINISSNKNMENIIFDYYSMLNKIKIYSSFISYITINISSPNNPNTQFIKDTNCLKVFLDKIVHYCIFDKINIPIFIKLTPDLSLHQIKEISNLLLQFKIDGIILTNTTKTKKGGLSGKPLFNLSTYILANFYIETRGKIPIIGVGGITSAEDAEIKIKAGASALQLYTAITYNGFSLINKILKELDYKLKKENTTIKDWCGSDALKYITKYQNDTKNINL